MTTPATRPALDRVVPGPATRLTVLGPTKGVDLALPNDETVAAVIPVLLDLLEVPPDAGTYHLVRVDGRVLPADLVLGESALRDGEVLRLRPEAATPPDPVVYDLVDALEEATPGGVWGPGWRLPGLTAVAVSLLMLAAGAASATVARTVPALPWIGAGLICLAGVFAARSRWARLAAGVAVGSAVLAFAVALALQSPWDSDVVWVLVAVPLVAAAVAWCLGRPRAAGAAVLCWGVVLLAAVIAAAASADLPLVAAVGAVVGSVLLGLLPRWALATTGAFSLDGELSRGRALRTHRVAAAVAGAHTATAVAVVTLAALVAVCAFAVGASSRNNPWLAGLAALLVVGWTVRTRHFPLLAERLAVWLVPVATIAGLIGALAVERPALGLVPVVVLVVLAAIVLLVAARPPTAVQAAQGRRWASRLETIAVAALVPVLVGATGLYSDLLATF